MFEKVMKKLGYISEKKVAKEIALIYHKCDYGEISSETEIPLRLQGWEFQSKLNSMCGNLGIKPMHLSKKLGAGTGEMLKGEDTIADGSRFDFVK